MGRGTMGFWRSKAGENLRMQKSCWAGRKWFLRAVSQALPHCWNTPKDLSQGRWEDLGLTAGKDDSKGKAWCGSMGGGGCSPPRRQQRYFFCCCCHLSWVACCFCWTEVERLLWDSERARWQMGGSTNPTNICHSPSRPGARPPLGPTSSSPYRSSKTSCRLPPRALGWTSWKQSFLVLEPHPGQARHNESKAGDSVSHRDIPNCLQQSESAHLWQTRPSPLVLYFFHTGKYLEWPLLPKSSMTEVLCNVPDSPAQLLLSAGDLWAVIKRNLI